MWVPEFSLDWTVPEAPWRISPVGFRQLLDVLRRGPQSRHCVLRSGRGEASRGRWGYMTSPHSCSRAFCVTEQRASPTST